MDIRKKLVGTIDDNPVLLSTILSILFTALVSPQGDLKTVSAIFAVTFLVTILVALPLAYFVLSGWED